LQTHVPRCAVRELEDDRVASVVRQEVRLDEGELHTAAKWVSEVVDEFFGDAVEATRNERVDRQAVGPAGQDVSEVRGDRVEVIFDENASNESLVPALTGEAGRELDVVVDATELDDPAVARADLRLVPALRDPALPSTVGTREAMRSTMRCRLRFMPAILDLGGGRILQLSLTLCELSVDISR
jgi:hypothetical protein